MGNLQRFCHTCAFWEWDENIVIDGKVSFPGHCGLWSADCINEVPAWFPGSPKPAQYRPLEVAYEEA